MKRWAAAALTTGLIVGGVVALPQAAFAATDVTGTVTQADGVTPIDHGIVTLTSTSNADDYIEAFVSAVGTFSTAEALPGTYTVHFDSYGYAPEFYSDSLARASATPVTIADGVPTIVNASLDIQSTITGTITDENNNPVDQALVSVFAQNNDWELVRQTITGADGIYFVAGVAAGNVKVFASDYYGNDLQSAWFGGGYSQATATPQAVPGAGGSAVADIVLPLGAIISGNIVDPMGLPAGVNVIASGAGLDYDTNGYAGNDGLYDVTGLHPQNYSVTTEDYRGLFAPAVPKTVTTAVGTPGTANFALTMNLVDESEFADVVTVLSGPTAVEAGKTYTWTLDMDGADNVYSILYPNPVFVGGAVRTTAGPVTITLTIPTATAAGTHKLTFSTYVDRGEGSFLLREYLSITVSAPTPASAVSDSALATTGASADTGAIGLLALLVSALGLLLVWFSSRSLRAGRRAQS